MIILIGPSASGKTEIAKLLIRYNDFRKFVTTTTRAMRPGEVNNIDYHFISVEEFKKEIEENSFIEYVTYNSNYYGTYKSEIADDKVLIVEPKGLNAFLTLNDDRIVSFYINSPKEVRRERMIERLDKPEEIKKRLEFDDEYFEEAKSKVDKIIENDGSKSLGEISQEIFKIYEEKLKATY